MIKVTVQYNDHLVDIHFPCSENTLQSALMEIHAADDNPPELFVSMFSRVLENGNDKAAFADLVERARTLLQSKGVDLPDEE